MRTVRSLFAILILCILSFTTMTLSADDKFVVVIDAGHGGGDSGTLHRLYKQDEKTIALNVALRLGRLIEWNYKDVKVVYTRKTDKYLKLPERVQKAKEAKGNLFISIHVNACPNNVAKGFETYVFGVDNSESAKKRLEERLVEERENLELDGSKVNFDTDIDMETRILCQTQREKHNKQSMEMAKATQNALISALKKTSYASNVKNRGVKSKNLFVLCFAPMPAILVELGYISNPDEEKFINSSEAQECFANSLYAAFKDYKGKWDKRQIKNSKVVEQPAQSVPQQQTPAKVEQPKQQPQQQAPAKTEQPKPQQQASTSPVWKIQFLTSDRLLKDGAPEFKGLKNVSNYKDGKVYKYTYGAAPSTKELAADLKKVKALFPTAFPVKFDGKGNRIK